MTISIQPTVEVIIPFHRVDDYLISAIDSIRSSSNVSIRIIAINDTGKHVDSSELSLKDSDLLIETSDRGYINALKIGVAATTEHYVAFLDSDDLVHPDKISKQIEFLEKNNLDFVSCGIQKVNSRNRLSTVGSLLGPVPRSKKVRELWLIGSHGADSTLLCKGKLLREYWFSHQSFEPHFADYGWALSLPSNLRIGHLADDLYYYRSHAGQISKFPNLGDSWKAIYPLWTKNLLNHFPIFSSENMPSERESLAIAFPASMLRLNQSEIENLMKFEKSLFSSLEGRSIHEISDWKITIARRILIASRGRAIRYWHAAPGLAWSVVLLRLFGFGFRKIHSE